MSYADFLAAKSQIAAGYGFDPSFLPSFLFDFQRYLVAWAVRQGRAAIFADCGMGKTPMQLVWAENVVRHTNRPVLILTPLAVASQTAAEAEKFGLEALRSTDVSRPAIYVTNYEKLHYYDARQFAGVVCDESSILKNFDGARRDAITEFMRTLPYRLLCTATAAPNDFTELGTSSEALGYLGHVDMLSRFFKNDRGNSTAQKRAWVGQAGHGSGPVWRFKGHAETPFWQWVASWARAIRRPSDYGFSDRDFVLPQLIEREHIVETAKKRDGYLFALPANGLTEQREERRISIPERCAKVAEIIGRTAAPAVAWCHLNDEADRLVSLMPGSVQVSGSDSDEAKEEKFMAFQRGQIRVLVIKPVIGAFGLNWQHCAHMTLFAGYSFEQYYQSIRRCWRFGQKNDVVIDHVSSDGESGILANRKRKAAQSDKMFSELVTHMLGAIHIDRASYGANKEQIPSWL